MKDRIIAIRGRSNTTTVELTEVQENEKAYGLYTYKGNVYVLKGGMDEDFENLSVTEQEEIVNAMESGKWKVNKALQ